MLAPRFAIGDRVYHALDDTEHASDYVGVIAEVHANNDGAISHPWDNGPEVWYILDFAGCVTGLDDTLTPESELVAHPSA